MNKQIEEMIKIMNETCNIYDEQGNHIRNKCGECECWSDDNHCCCSYNSKEAEALYNAGYRKIADVTGEIFAEIAKCLHIVNFPFINSEGCLTPIHAPYLAIYPNDLAELKKKYESEGIDDE